MSSHRGKLKRPLSTNIVAIVLTFCLSGGGYAFELLSEGAMDSVSAVSAGSVEDILNVAGPTAAGLRVDDDYEELPFDVDYETTLIQRDEVELELNFALTQEVEVWADSLRKSGQTDFEVEVIEQLSITPLVDIITGPGKLPTSSSFEGGSGGSLDYQFGKLKLEKDSALIGFDQMQGSLKRYLESASVVDNRTGLDRPLSTGSGYISDVTSRTNIIYTGRTRD